MKTIKSIFILFLLVISFFFNSCEKNIAKEPAKTFKDSVIKKSPTFLFLSDIHLDSHKQTTLYGQDTGMILWRAFLAKVDAVISDAAPDFIIYTGDLPSHTPWVQPLPKDERPSHNENIATILSGLRDLATKHKIALLYLPGNNDGIAGDYASFSDEKQQTPFSLIPENQNPYPALNTNTVGGKIPCIVSNPAPKMGYYSARPIEGLRVIALNTVIHSAYFIAADGSNQMDDAQNQMAWFANELKDAERKGEKAYISMHIPPGIDAFGYKKKGLDATNWAKLPASNPWNNQFLQIVSDYQKTIAGVLYGHTHMDELRRLYDPSGKKITEVAISCPGVTPIHNNNPGFKLVNYDATSKEFLDFTTYYTTIPAAITWGDAKYSFNQKFGYSSNRTMYENLSLDSFSNIHTKLNGIFTVMHGPAGYDISTGIAVKYEYKKKIRPKGPS
jgi:sphingomyelin phosphodiesterase acid-like 3